MNCEGYHYCPNCDRSFSEITTSLGAYKQLAVEARRALDFIKANGLAHGKSLADALAAVEAAEKGGAS